MADQLKIPDGFTIIENSMVLMLVKSEDVGKNPGVHAVCWIAEGEQRLLQRYYDYIASSVNEIRSG